MAPRLPAPITAVAMLIERTDLHETVRAMGGARSGLRLQQQVETWIETDWRILTEDAIAGRITGDDLTRYRLDPTDARFTLMAHLLVRVGSKTVRRPASLRFITDQRGVPLRVTSGPGEPSIPAEMLEMRNDGGDQLLTQTLFGNLDVLANPCLMALSMCHMRGVVVEPEQRELPPKVLARQTKELGHEPVLFRTLTIRTRSIREVANGETGEAGPVRRLHFARGHFKHYTKDKPLFGKYVGTVWCPEHVRGAVTRGAVVKDYRVKP
jgi:hypothetical protein